MSRDPSDLHAPLLRRWEWLRDEWRRRWPDDAQPFLTDTYRDEAAQEKAYREGASHARFGQSLHNYRPAYAFDVAFMTAKGTLDWDWRLFERWGEMGESLGLEWGGRWEALRDGPHLQMPMTYRDAQAGRVPALPPLPRPVYELFEFYPLEEGPPWTMTHPFVLSIDGVPVETRGRKVQLRPVRG